MINRNNKYLPIILAIIFAAGIFLGTLLNTGSTPNTNNFSFFNKSQTKFPTILSYISQDYVDTVNIEQLEDNAISHILSKLDPHSEYILAKEFNKINDPLFGNFDGIGVQFRIEKDTVMIIRAISGGPSEKIGIRDGDRIVTIDNDTVAGIGVTNQKVMKKLKGPKGTKVNVGIFRQGVKNLISYTITRDIIPTFSVDISYKPTDSIGYIKLNKFSATSYKEVRSGLEKLKSQGANKIILDLRGNGGGYMQAAIQIADEFLSNKKLIVYTEGNNRPKQSAYATKNGICENDKIIVLIDGGSASASEILAGAIQDNDRGIIIGRRSFGKGLVQEQIRLQDGSAVRLVVSRYHTPTGRCIQKPYNNGKSDYYDNFYNRWLNGELEYADSIKFNDSLKYTTPKGKIVYGGGGITPDIFVSIKDKNINKYMSDLIQQGMFYRFAFDYADKHREELQAYNNASSFINDFSINKELLKEFNSLTKKEGIVFDKKLYNESLSEIKLLLKSLIGRNIYDNEGFYPIYLQTD
ncbi:MAG: S41 family peptidase, partial [Bacteroidota bacterium]|nr:S41 family peptidase [Bacteroidota bacterium]